MPTSVLVLGAIRREAGSDAGGVRVFNSILALDKAGYRAGETMKVTITPPHPGPGILLVESDHLLHVQPIEAKAGATYELAVTKDWERHDVYVTALVFRGGSAVEKVTRNPSFTFRLHRSPATIVCGHWPDGADG